MIIRYTVTKLIPNLPDPLRLGTSVAIDTSVSGIKLAKFPPLETNDDFVIAESGDGRSQEVTIKGSGFATGSMEFSFIDDQHFDVFDEFYQSTRKREVFEIDTVGVRGHSGLYDARRADNGKGMDHANIHRGYTLFFNFRVINTVDRDY